MGIIVLLIVGFSVFGLRPNVDPIAADAAVNPSGYWSLPDNCPNCGVANGADGFHTITYTDAGKNAQGENTYSFLHMGIRGQRVCSGTIVVHTGYHVDAVPATCTASGNTAGVKCSICGAMDPYNLVYPLAALGHDYEVTWTWDGYESATAGLKCSRCALQDTLTAEISETVSAEATCTVQGLRIYTATVSYGGDDYTNSKFETIPPLGHDYEYVQTTAPTCTETGIETATCTRCGDEQTQTVAALGHSEVVDPAVPATCSTSGKTEGSHCSRCLEVLTPQEDVPALGHDMQLYMSSPATCTRQGEKWYQCSRCSYRTVEYTPMLAHDWMGYVQTTAPTCTKSGVQTDTCAKCSTTRTQSIPALGHDPVSDDIAATCTSSGTSGRNVCSRCRMVTVSGTTVAALGHSYTWTTTSSATCILGGTQRGTCSRCGDTTTRSTSALGHDMHTSIYSATCTSGGYTYHYCSRCSLNYESDQTSALGHNYGSYTQTKAPTCTATGTETAKCTRCSATTSRTVAALGHDYGSYVQTTAPTCTTLGEEKATCSRCGAETSRTVAALGHASVTDPAVPATCTETGLTDGAHCSRCDTVIKAQQEVPALGHDWGAYAQTKAPTCTAAGTETAKCTRCSSTTSRAVAALGHSSVTDAAVAATCTMAGKTEGSHCSRCDAIITAQEEIPALGHDWGEYAQTTAPTCTTTGVETSTCSRCHETRTRSIPAKGHTLGPDATCTEDQTCIVCGALIASAGGHNIVTDPAVPATCTEDGKMEGSHCSVCGEVFEAQEIVPKLGHDYGAYSQTKAPTCTTLGEEKATCSRCGAETTRTVAALGHSSVTDPAVSATCTETGLTDGTHCSRCNAVIKAQQEVPALGHDWGAYAQTKAPTCTEEGVETSECTRCGETQTREIEALGHFEVIDEAVSATCTASGKTEGIHCSRCNAVIKAQEEVPALGHDWGEYAQTKAPTCTEKGIETSECTRCGETQTRDIDALGHIEVIDEAVSATCTASGKTEGIHCSRCNAVIKAQEEVPALGHDWGEYVQTTAPTCTEEGVKTSTCSRCDEERTQSIPANGHTLGPDATCTEDQVCTVCGEVVSAASGHIPGPAATCTAPQVCSVCGTELVPALGHDLQHHEAKAATCTEIGWNAYDTCSRCDYTTYEEIAAKGHTAGPAATCLTAQTCTVCGTELAPALGHDLQHHEAKAATCTEIGWNAYDTCSRCDYTTYEEIAAKGHTPGAEPTCVTPQTCTVCGAELNAALGHDLQHHEAKAATCTEIGWNAYDTCSRCDYTTYAEIAAKGHTPGSEPTCVTPQTCTVCGSELKAALEHTEGPEPTCTEAQVCTVCGVELAPELGHVNVIDEAVPATCTETGLTEGAHCSRCEEVLLEQDVVPALGHFLLAVEDSRESCTDDGTLTRRCDRCDYVEVKEVSGGTHSWRPGDILREPTCADVGIQELRCVFCAATMTSEIARLQHKVVDVPAVAPTCTEPGATYGLQCAVCGTVLLARDYIPALQHDMTYVAGQAPTATEDGYAAHYACSHCGGLFADEDGEQAVSEDDLRIPADSPDIDDGEEPLPGANDEDKGMTPLQIDMAVVALVVLLAVIFAVVSAFGGKKKRRKIK